MFFFDVDENIQLRILEIKYAELMFTLIDKERNYLREWLPWVDGTKSFEDTKIFINFTLKNFAENNGFTAAIFFKEEFAGCVGIEAIHWSKREASIGGWLGSEYQGKGIMTKSCNAIIDHLFRDLGLNRVEMRAAEHNHKSRAIPERLGFKKEGIVKDDEWLNGRFVDSAVYSLLRENWEL